MAGPRSSTLDQGSQFTSFAFTTTLRDAASDQHGRARRWMDNVFIERLWRSLKYECVFLNAFETGSEATSGIGRWFGYYNAFTARQLFVRRQVLSTPRNEIGGVRRL